MPDKIIVSKFTAQDIPDMLEIWNEIVEAGEAFPQLEKLKDYKDAKDFFDSQTYCGVAKNEDGDIVGLYILHPNNIGRCGHIANASYAVKKGKRGLGTGERLVMDSLRQAKKSGFSLMQFNAVVVSNTPAHRLYKKLGFNQLGIIPQGFMYKDGKFQDIAVYWKLL